MKNTGTITSWIDEKGYGFISAAAGDDRVFVHINAFKNRGRRPTVGDTVSYSLSEDARGRPRAENVAISGSPQRTKARRTSGFPALSIAAGFFLIVGGAAIASAIPLSILLLYLVGSLVTFAAYSLDKAAAKSGSWRTSENTLHVLSLIGGWPGALIAQNRLRHKTKKMPFRAIFWATVALNCAAFVWLFTPGGLSAWHLLVSMIGVGA